jgi:hypothetical protein
LWESLPVKRSLELVVALHREDPRWIRRVPSGFAVTVYEKGGPDGPPFSPPSREGIQRRSLPNLGREAHTYLTHILERYDSLPDITVFCQGHPFDHAPDFHARLRALAEGSETADPFLWYGFLDDTDDPCGRRLFVPWSKNPERKELPTGEIFTRLLGDPAPPFFHFRGGAQFAVSREGVRDRPRSFYGRALEETLTDPLAAHCFERIWDRVFGPAVIVPASLGPDGVRYHKRIRRLEEGSESIP